MPGGRPILGADVHAALACGGGTARQRAALAAAVAPDAAFLTLEELAEACPPERIGLSVGAYVRLFGLLFGEFE